MGDGGKSREKRRGGGERKTAQNNNKGTKEKLIFVEVSHLVAMSLEEIFYFHLLSVLFSLG